MRSKTLGSQRRRVTVRGLMAITSATTPLALLAGAMVLPLAQSANADNMQVWTGATNNNWNNTGNWSPNVIPVLGDTLTFGTNVTGPIMDDLGDNMFASQLNFANTNSTQILATTAEQTFILSNNGTNGGVFIPAGNGPVTFGNTAVGGSGVINFSVAGAITFLNNSSFTLGINGAVANTSFQSGTSNAVLTIDGSGNTFIGGALQNNSGAGTTLTLVKNGSGTLEIDGNTTVNMTGGITINNGQVNIKGSDSLGISNDQLTFNGGGLAALGAARTIPASDHVTIGGNFSFGGAVGNFGLTFGAPITLDGGTPTITVNSPLQFNAAILNGTNGSGFTKAGSAQMTLNTTSSSYSGPTTVGAGTLAVSGAATDILSPNSDYSVSNGATLNLAGFGQIIGSLAGAGNVTIGNSGAAPITMGGDNASTTFSGTITGTGTGGGLTKSGSGTFVLSGSDSNAGANGLTVNGGVFVASNSGGMSLPNFSTVAVNGSTFQLAAANQQINSSAAVTLSSGTVDLNSLNLSVGSLTGDANSSVALGGGTLTVTGASSTTYSGNIADAGGASSNTGGTLVMAGSGTLNLASSTGMTLPNMTVNSGTVTLGGGSGATAPFNVTGTMTINDGTEVAYLSNPSGGVTNTVSSLVINGGGQLDLANHTLVTTTSASTIRQYLIAGANIVGTNPATWNGTGGISSVNAAASTNHLTALGYSSGTHSALGIALGLASNQTVVKYTIYGDANLDGSVDISDLDIVLSNYASGKPPSWDTGDFTYAGQTDITDLNIVLSNYAKSAPNSVATPSVARSGVKAASTSSGPQTLTGTVSPAVASGAIELDVNSITGDAVLNPNNAKVVSLQVASSSGNLIPNNWHDLSFYYGTPNWADSSFQTINLAEYDTAYTSRHNSLLLTAPVDYGDIFNTSGPRDLTFEYGIPDADGSDVDTEVGAVVYSPIPEPTTLGLMGLAMAGLMGRRRRKEQK